MVNHIAHHYEFSLHFLLLQNLWKLAAIIVVKIKMLFFLGDFDFPVRINVSNGFKNIKYNTLLAKSKISRHKLASLAEQAGMSLTWLVSPKTGVLVTGLIWTKVTSWSHVFRQTGLGNQCRSDYSWRSSLNRVYTVCHSVCIFWMYSWGKKSIVQIFG